MLQNISILNTLYNDAPQPWQIGFQDSASPAFTGIIDLHNSIFFYLIVICVGVFWALGSYLRYCCDEVPPSKHHLGGLQVRNGTMLQSFSYHTNKAII